MGERLPLPHADVNAVKAVMLGQLRGSGKLQDFREHRVPEIKFTQAEISAAIKAWEELDPRPRLTFYGVHLDAHLRLTGKFPEILINDCKIDGRIEVDNAEVGNVLLIESTADSFSIKDSTIKSDMEVYSCAFERVFVSRVAVGTSLSLQKTHATHTIDLSELRTEGSVSVEDCTAKALYCERPSIKGR